MQRDIKLGLIVGAILLVLCAVFYVRSGGEDQAVAPAPSETEAFDFGEPSAEEPQSLDGSLPKQSKIEDIETEGQASVPTTPVPAIESQDETTRAVIEGTVEETIQQPMAEPDKTPAPPTVTEDETEVPEREPLPVIKPPLLVEGEVYVVGKGDTLADISNQFYGTSQYWKRIFEANRDILSSPDKLMIGMELTIPAFPVEEQETVEAAEPKSLAEIADEGVRRHIVARGETLTSISEFYFGNGNKWKEIASANPTIDPNRLQIGQVIVIPND